MSRRQAPTEEAKQENNKPSEKNLNNISFLDLKEGFLEEINSSKTHLEKDKKNINLTSMDNTILNDPIL